MNFFGKIKICEFYMFFFVKENIFGFKITIYYIIVMEIIKGRYYFGFKK